MTVTTITCTCGRPEAFALLEKYLARQTRQPDQMIVLDDGAEPVKCTLGQDYYYVPHCRGRGSMTSKLAMAFSAGLVKGDACVVAEDDDWIAPTWIGWCEDKLTRQSLIGEGRALYYNVRHRWWFEHENMRHASLCSTAFTKAVYPTVIAQSRIPDPFVDDRIWRNFHGSKQVFSNQPRLVIGIKEVPGLFGYGSGRGIAKNPGDRTDTDLHKLRELIGADADLYAGFYQKP